jgi:hypothetical protein
VTSPLYSQWEVASRGSSFCRWTSSCTNPRRCAGSPSPRLVCIEAHPQVRQPILDYFAAHDYVIVGKGLRMDTENLWFAPRARAK